MDVFEQLEHYFLSRKSIYLQFYHMDIESNTSFVEELQFDKPQFLLYKNGEKHLIQDFVYQSAKNIIEKIYEQDIRTIETMEAYDLEKQENEALLIYYGEYLDSSSELNAFCENRIEFNLKCVIINDIQLI